jgi:hypothetical protein
MHMVPQRLATPLFAAFVATLVLHASAAGRPLLEGGPVRNPPPRVYTPRATRTTTRFFFLSCLAFHISFLSKRSTCPNPAKKASPDASSSRVFAYISRRVLTPPSTQKPPPHQAVNAPTDQTVLSLCDCHFTEYGG